MEQRKTIKTIDSIPFALGFQRENTFNLSRMIENLGGKCFRDSVKGVMGVMLWNERRINLYIHGKTRKRNYYTLKREKKKNFSTFLVLSAFKCN
jgi:hypothetical protein